ncbi:MAG: DUF2927 domain-containing protein [Rhodobacteraceae bacterium]|nr:DUF2927 domain-containing protein [Paracoccaceae bacterium]
MRCTGLIASVLAMIGMTGCNTLARQDTVMPTAATRAAPQAVMPVRPRISHELEDYYSKVQAKLLAQGLLRVDGGGPDTPFTADMLARNFMRIALFEEFTAMGGSMVAKQTPSTLHRWKDPVRVQVEFGNTVPRDKRLTDRTRLTRLVDRLHSATGHPIREVQDRANFHIFVVNEQERQALAPELRKIIPNISEAAVKAVTRMPRSNYCLVLALDPHQTGDYTKAIAVIRAEHPDLMRLSCLHEEVAQGLGLSNDSPLARPSVFNDDEEFGLLTYHDELLLRMLYDPRLTPGMTPAQAGPIVHMIAEELVNSGTG